MKHISLRTMTYGKPTAKTSVPLQYKPLETVTRLLFVTFNNSSKFTVYGLRSIEIL